MLEEIVLAKSSWFGIIRKGQRLKITDLEGQQAVDVLCYHSSDRAYRCSATNTVKVQRNGYVGLGSILFSDRGVPLLEVVEDTIVRHDTVYGSCSNTINMLRDGVETYGSCYIKIEAKLSNYDMGKDASVSNVNLFTSMPVLEVGSAGVNNVVLKPKSYVKLLAVTDTLAALSNYAQMHAPCNGYNPTPIQLVVH